MSRAAGLVILRSANPIALCSGFTAHRLAPLPSVNALHGIKRASASAASGAAIFVSIFVSHAATEAIKFDSLCSKIRIANARFPLEIQRKIPQPLWLRDFCYWWRIAFIIRTNNTIGFGPVNCAQHVHVGNLFAAFEVIEDHNAVVI